MRLVVLIGLSAVLMRAPIAAAQGGIPVAPGWGVNLERAPWSEASWHSAAEEIYRAWSDYLGSDARRQAPTPYWSEAEQQRWPHNYDLMASVAYQGFPGTVLDIRPAEPGSTDEFIVRTLFGSVAGGFVRPLAITRVYAIRERDRWVFANALPKLTSTWPRATIGAFTFVSHPARELDLERAADAVAFADSVAALFDIPSIDSLTYYVDDDPENLRRVMGIDWHGSHGAAFGMASAANSIIWSADPAFGEAHYHEIVHVVLRPILAEGRTPPWINEGVATWLGGSGGHMYPDLMGHYAAYLRANEEVTLDVALDSNGSDLGSRPAAAALVHLVNEHAGIAAVKDLLTSGPNRSDFRSAIIRILGVDWLEIARLWRAYILEFEPVQ